MEKGQFLINFAFSTCKPFLSLIFNYNNARKNDMILLTSIFKLNFAHSCKAKLLLRNVGTGVLDCPIVFKHGPSGRPVPTIKFAL